MREKKLLRSVQYIIITKEKFWRPEKFKEPTWEMVYTYSITGKHL